VLTDGRGVPLGAVIEGANRNDHKLMRPTLEAIPIRRPIAPSGTVKLSLLKTKRRRAGV
jgi:hypothetical protein